MIREFLAKLVPEGLMVIAVRSPKGFRNIVCDDLDDALDQVAMNKLKSDHDIYFGLGSLCSTGIMVDDKKRVRVRNNISELKSLFIDIDVDPSSYGNDKYFSVEEAEEAILKFVADNNLPAPMIVGSGGGLHVYWPLTKAVSRDSWQPIAHAFKDVLNMAGVKYDRTRTADASSVLRVIGTQNIKRGTTVKLIRDCDPIKPSVMAAAVMALASTAPIAQVMSGGIVGSAPEIDLGSNTTREFPPCDFDEVLSKCAQVKNLYETGGDSEPLWYAGIALARHMTEPEDAAIAMSEEHKKYSEAETLGKLHQSSKEATGPTTCKRFKEFGPAGLCEKCPKYGKIATPAQLGQPESVMAKIKDESGVMQLDHEKLEPPFPYSREGGKVMFRPPEGKPVTISPVDLYPVARKIDQGRDVNVITWRAHIENAPRKDLDIPQSLLGDPAALNKLLLSKGLTISPSNASKVANYMVAYIHKLQQQMKAEKLISELGWNEDHSSFTLAPTEYHADGTISTHTVSEDLTNNMPGLSSKGTLEGWVEGMEFYNTPGHEAHQLMICGAFGSPLYHMTGHAGALVFASGESGTGKTTVLRAMNSIWGHPGKLLLNGTKNGMTPNARVTKFGMYKNISVCMDEVTNWTGPQFSNMALEISQGEGKARSTQSGALAKMKTFWSFIGFASSNSDAYDTISSANGAAGAESMRVFQLHMTLPTAHSKEVANQYANVTMLQNYGLAGHVYSKYIAEHYDEIQLEVTRMVDKISGMAGGESSERFWVGVLAVSYVAGCIAKKLGLIDFDMVTCIKWGMSQMKRTRTRVKDSVSSPADVVAEFLDTYTNETLVMEASASGNQRIEMEPRGPLTIRYDKDRMVVYITRSRIKSHCAELGVNFTEMEDVLASHGVLTNKSIKKVLGALTQFSKAQVRCWEIDMNKL